MPLRLAALFLLVLATAAGADPLLPAAGDSGVDRTLADLAAGFQRQQDVFATLENGIQLDVFFNAADVALVRSFFAQSASNDFLQVTGRHPFTVVNTFEEWGDEGNFAGTASVGAAARLMVLRRDGAPAAELASARAAAIRSARTWHVFASIGGPGVIARGIRRTVSTAPADPPLPSTIPPTVPFTDGGAHWPVPKEDAWRTPLGGGDGGWIWVDNTSKDQVIGYVAASTWLYDALVGDPEVPADVTQDLSNDLVAFAHALMQVAPELGIDLCIRDADGRLTAFHDLNPRELTPGLVTPVGGEQNGFNATLAMAVIRAAYHVSGDAAIGDYYYNELVTNRRFPGLTTSLNNFLFFGPNTNFSNVNMLAIAYSILERVETDTRVRGLLQNSIQTAFWDTGNSRDCLHSKEPWFDVVYASFSPLADPNVIAERVRTQLSQFQPAPAFERNRINCDPWELDAGVCLAVDGVTTITLETGMSRDQHAVATEPLPMSIRPDSDHLWRSDPFQVNAAGDNSTLMDPRGDYLAAYWLGRLIDRDPSKNLSPNARPWPPPVVITPKPPASGCHCASFPASEVSLLAGFVLLLRRRR